MGFISDLFGGAPDPPSPKQIANAQLDVNRQTQEMNLAAARTNQVGPTGALIYNQTGTDARGNPTYTAFTGLSQDQQRILDILEQNKMGLGATVGSAIEDFNMMDIPSYIDDYQPLVQEMLDRQLDFINPYYETQISNLDSKLRNQGIVPGMPAYDNAMRTLTQNQNSSIGAFLNSAQSQAFNQSMSRFDAARRTYNTPLDTISRIMSMTSPEGFTPVPTPTANMAAPNITSAFGDQYKAELDRYNQGWSNIGAIGSAIMGLPTAGIGSATIGSTLGASAGAGLSNMLGLV